MYHSHKIFVLSCLFIVLFHSANAQQIDKIHLTLAEIWEKAAANNKTLKMQDLKVLRTLEGIKDAKAERLPEISAEAEYSRLSNLPIYTNGLFHTPDQYELPVHTSYSFGGDAYLNLYHGGKVSTRISAEKKENEIAVEQKKLSTEDIKLRATAYYLDLQRSRIFKELLLKDISTQEKQLSKINQLLKNGVVLKSDVLRGTLKLSRQKMSLLQLDNDILIASQKLNILTGLPDETVIEPENGDQAEMPVIGTYSEYLNEAMEHSPVYQISEKEAQLIKLNIKSIMSDGALQLGLFSNYNYSYPQIQIYPYSVSMYGLGFGGIKASYPISALYHNRHKVKAAEIQYRQQELEHSNTGDKIRQEVNEAFLRYREALTRIDVAKENISQATENLRIVSNTYFNQLSLITDLLDADTQLLQTRFDYAAARIAAQLQYYQLQKAIGKL
jgi:outer membrane protein